MNESPSTPQFSPPPPVAGKNILCLALDRLSADFLGPYGNAWIETSAFDALAAESVVFDSFFATSLDLETLYRAFWRGENPAKIDADSDDSDVERPSLFRILKEKGYRTFVVSDVESVALHSAIDDDFCDGRFFLEPLEVELPAEKLEETRFFRNFEELARFLARLDDDAKTAGADARPWFVWAHFSGWNDLWDFPLDRREHFREDEEDPEAYSATFVPFWPRDDADASKKGPVSTPRSAPPDAVPSDAELAELDDEDEEIPDGEIARQFAALEFARLSALDAPERRQSVVEAYCGGVSVFDETLGGFVQLLKETGILDKTLFAILATRGFPTGFPGPLGVAPTSESATEIFAANLPEAANGGAPFYSETIQAPLAIRAPNGAGATVRLPALCEPRDVFATLRDWPEFSDELATSEFWRFEPAEISPFAGRWSAETGENDDPTTPKSETLDAFDPAAPDVPGQNLLRLLANEEDAPRDRIAVVARDAASAERALVVDDWLLKTTPIPTKNDAAPFATSDAETTCVREKFELFVRPDDRFNVNDVANRCVEIVEKLAAATERQRSFPLQK